MGDLMASGTNPGSTYTITAGNPGVYHEDRVVVSQIGASTYTTQMFRVYGASLIAGLWQFQSGVSTAYATVQNPDGSIHYFTYSGPTGWSTTDWKGANNNTVYNAADFAANGGANPADLTAALTATFTAIFNTSPAGGMVWIPEFGYQIDSVSQSSSIPGLQVPYGTIIQGLGTGGQNQSGGGGAFHFNINGTGSGPIGNTLFYLSGAHNSGGTKFKDLGFQWLSSGTANDQCINANDQWNVVAEGCVFKDCPIAFNSASLASGLLNSSISYTAGSPNNAVAVILQHPEAFAFGPGKEYAQDPITPDVGSPTAAGPTNCVGVMICGNPSYGEHCQVIGLHLSDWSYGVCFNTSNPWPNSGFGNFATATMNQGHPLPSGSQYALIHGIECEAYVTAIYIQPASSSETIYGVKISDSYLLKSHSSQDDGGNLLVPGAIVYIDTNQGPNSNVVDIELVNCTIFSDVSSAYPHQGIRRSKQYGVNISTGDNIRIIGGRISNCGTMTSPTNDGTANIAITGAVGMVTIDGVNLSAQAAQALQQCPSQWGLLVSGNITGPVNVTNCNFGVSHWGPSGPVSVTGTTSASNPLYITNCPGYNDQNTVINTLTHVSTGIAYAAYNQGSNGGTSYYGPSFVMFTAGGTGPSPSAFQYNGGVSQILVPNQVVCLTLASPYDTIQFNVHAPTAFTWIGK